jgi:hypothetical protein
VTTPAAEVSTATTTLSYFSPAQVTASSNKVVTTNGTIGQSSPGVSAGAVVAASGGGSSPNAANGDCGATGVNCTSSGDAVVPGTPSAGCSSYEACFQTFWTAVQSAPLVTAITGLSTAWPSGACPTYTLTLATIPGHTFDYGTTMCSLWGTYALPALSGTTMVVWSLVGIFILMSA